jgi:hypothetical protein
MGGKSKKSGKTKKGGGGGSVTEPKIAKPTEQGTPSKRPLLHEEEEDSSTAVPLLPVHDAPATAAIVASVEELTHANDAKQAAAEEEATMAKEVTQPTLKPMPENAAKVISLKP